MSLSAEDPANYSNNQSPPSDLATIGEIATTYTRDTDYYGPDDIGIFLVNSTLFKVHATQIFGPRPASTPESMKGISPTYLEDILPRLPSSSDSKPIVLPGVTVSQFRNYLRAATFRLGDTDLAIFCQEYYEYCIDTATLARLFGTTKLEEWAMGMLHSIFSRLHSKLAELDAHIWSADSLLHLRNLSRNTKLDQPVIVFIQYFISVNLKDTVDDSSLNARACVDLYDVIKCSNTEPVLLGCVFLSLLSLGHRSSIWTECMPRKDRAILYAAQVQLVDATHKLCNLKWLLPVTSHTKIAKSGLCDTCKAKLTAFWDNTFGVLGRCLGSGPPFTDASLLAQIGGMRWDFQQYWGFGRCCDWGEGDGCLYSPRYWLDFLDNDIPRLYGEIAALYKKLAEEF